MELPPELVLLVKEYSKPLLRYPKEYKDVLGMKTVREWPELKKKLYNDDIIQAVRDYIEIKNKLTEAEKISDFSVRWNLIEPCSVADRNLMVAVYGEPKPGQELPWAWWMPYSTWYTLDSDESDDE